MPSWEETKRAAQTAFTMTGNGFQDVYSGLGNTYQQFLRTGYLPSYSEREGMTQQIIDDFGWPQVNPEYERADRLYHEQEEEREHHEAILKDIEPEGR